MSGEKKYKVNQIVRTIQGEGQCTGEVTVLCRFSGCNLKCDFCDTDHESYVELTAEELASRLIENVTHDKEGMTRESITLTGGEPLLQLDAELLEIIDSHFESIIIETNGTKDVPSRDDVSEYILDEKVWVVWSPKSSKTFRETALSQVSEIKVVLPGDWSFGDLMELARFVEDRYEDWYPDFTLQPMWDNEKGEMSQEGLRRCVDYALRNPRWRVRLQAHKFMGVA